MKHAEVGSVFAINDKDNGLIDKFRKVSNNKKRCFLSVINKHAAVSAYDIWMTFGDKEITKE